MIGKGEDRKGRKTERQSGGGGRGTTRRKTRKDGRQEDKTGKEAGRQVQRQRVRQGGRDGITPCSSVVITQFPPPWSWWELLHSFTHSSCLITTATSTTSLAVTPLITHTRARAHIPLRDVIICPYQFTCLRWVSVKSLRTCNIKLLTTEWSLTT